MTTHLLAAYDAALRGRAELVSADDFDRDEPLWRGRFGDRGFVTYRDLAGLSGAALDELIARTVAHYAADPRIRSFEWKTRGHDAPADLPEHLVRHGLVPEDRETVMVGEARLLALDVPLPSGVTLRRIDNQPDPMPDLVRAARAQAAAFGSDWGVDDLLRRIKMNGPNLEVWVAEAGGAAICVGRLEVVPGTPFAGLWGGGTVPEWRGRGVYRALTAARARSALERGVTHLHSDCTDFSRPILEQSGLVAVTTTTPYVWTR